MTSRIRMIADTVLVVAIAGLAGPAAAQQSPLWTSCQNKEQKVSRDQQIGACTGLIESGKLSTNNLSLAYAYRGLAYKNKGQFDRAIQDYDQAIKINPQNAGAYGNRGNAYDEKRQYDRAISDYDQTLRLRPNDAVAFYRRSLAKKAKGDLAGAEADMAAARRIDPNIDR